MSRGRRTSSCNPQRVSTPSPALARLADARTPAERASLVEEAVRDHLPLADALARQYAHRGIELDDLVQVARLGLLLAIERFQPEAGTPFEAFAVPTIKGEIKRYFRDHGWVVRPPRRIQELRARMRSARDSLEQQGGHAPTTAELARELDVDADDLAECAAADNSFTPLSLDATFGGQDTPLVERLESAVSGVDSVADVLALRRELGRLRPRQLRVLRWRFADGLTQCEIGALLGVSQMQVSRILSATLAQLRIALDPAVPQRAA